MVTLKSGPHCPWGAQGSKLQPAHPGSALKGSCWLLEEADGSPEPMVRGASGSWWSGHSGKVKAGGKYPCVEEGKGLLTGYVAGHIRWAWGVAGNREEDSGKAGRV